MLNSTVNKINVLFKQKGQIFYLIQSGKVKSKLWCYTHKAILHKNYYILTMVAVFHTNTVHTLHTKYFFLIL